MRCVHGATRKRVGAEIILAVAIADRQRRPHPRADDQVGIVAEQEGDGEGADEPWQHCGDRLLRRGSALDFARDEVPDHLGIGLALELAALRRSARRAAA